MIYLMVGLILVVVLYVGHKATESEYRRTMCDNLNEVYGGDWYYDKLTGCYRDYMTDRKVAG